MIRRAEASDAHALSELLTQLGYPSSALEISARLEKLAKYQCAVALVAINGFGEVVGLVTGHLVPSIHDNQPVAWLTTLVVLEDARGAGIGSSLVGQIEQWAMQNGAKRLAVTSATHREEAHAFYEKRDYARTGLRFGKCLSGDISAERAPERDTLMRRAEH
jgi:predicted N-acetyltransferase YhbS